LQYWGESDAIESATQCERRVRENRKMKKKMLLIVALGMSITPALFAGSLGQLRSSEIAQGGFICGKSLSSSKSSAVVVEAVSSKSKGSSAQSAK
jgi:hypothetical protein